MEKPVTRKIYHEDPYQQSCRAKVVDIRTVDGKEWLLLDQTLFYPGGGGQAPDKGTINGVKLSEIRSDAQGIWHHPDQKMAVTVADELELRLNWDWRFYQMQQHTGQHLLSHVLYKAGLHTVSVHLGEEHTMIEVEGFFPDEKLLQKIEQQANALIRSALSVTGHWTDKAHARKFPLRRKAGEHEALRVVEIEKRDYVACAGTHLASTGQIGLIKWLGLEKIRKRTRLEYVIGQKAYTYFNRLHALQNSLKKILHNDFTQFEQRVLEMQNKIARQKKQLNFFRKKYLENYIQDLSRDGSSVVLKLEKELQEEAALITRKLAEEHKKPALICSGERFFMALPAALAKDAREFLKREDIRLELKGGGTADFVQGKLTRHNEEKLKLAFFNFLAEK